MKRYFLGTILVGLIVFGSFNLLRSRRGAVTIEAIRVQRKTLKKSITSSGALDSEVKAELKFETSGKVSKLLARVGERVEKGQALASLDQRELKEGSFRAEMNLKKARADLDKVVELRRQFREEHENDSPSSELFAQFAQYDAQVRGDEALVEYYNSQVESARIALSHAVLVSPLSGTVTEINIIEGELFQVTSGPAIVVANLSPENLYFKAGIDEADLGKVVIDQKAEITLDAEDNKIFRGTVKKIASQTSLNKAGDKIIEAKVFFDEDLPENLCLLGLSGDAEIVISRSERTLTFPLEAVFEEDGIKFVWKVQNGQAKKTKIEVGLESEFEIEITSGLSEGDLVAAEKLDLLKEGQKVKIEK